MFDKLSQRERLMAITVAILFPVAIAMYLGVTVSGSLSDRASQLNALTLEQQELTLKKAAARRVINRGEFYRQESLPSDINHSVLDYFAWLNRLTANCFGNDGKSKPNVTKGIMTSENQGVGDLIFTRQEFTVSTTTSLRQVTNFLYQFYEARILHRIKTLTIKPELEGAGDRQTMTGRLVVTIGVEVAALANADPERDFANEKRQAMLRSVDEYHDVVTRRNLFGLPNEAPDFTTSGSVDLETGSAVSVPLKASDDGAPEMLKYELVESSAPEAKLVIDASKATLSAPALPKGRHQFLVRVTDNGWPRKSDELELSVNVDDPEPIAKAEEPPPPKYARYAFVSGFTTNLTGAPVVWIKVPQPDNETHRLIVGESFELDGQQWKVTEIAGERVTFDVDGNVMSFKLRSTLVEPVVESGGISSNR